MLTFIGLVLIVVACFYGGYANPLWKQFDESSTYAGGIYRAVLGIPAWITIICLMLKKWDVMFPCLIITAALLALPFMRMKKDGYQPVKPAIIILFASLGAYSRIIMAWTIIGIFVNRQLSSAAEIGWGKTAEIFFENAAKNQSSGPSITETISDIFEEDRLRKEKERAEEAAREANKVEVYKEDELGNMRKVQVNSDNSMYRDPDTGEWEKIKK